MEQVSVLIWGGATGQAKLLATIMEYWGHQLKLFVDVNQNATSPFPEIENVLGEKQIESRLQQGNLPSHFVVPVAGDGKARCNIADKLQKLGLHPLTLVHPRAWVAETVEIGAGCQILGMAAISEGAVLGRQTIINTNATVDHDSKLGEGVHVMPGATVTGLIDIGDHVTIGSNATILPRLKIGKGAIVGAGAVVTKNVPANTIVVGVPAVKKE